jgi:dephospho-CoA kinase
MSTRVRRPDAGDGVFILGLVGRTGSGKSTVARALEADGARVIEADQIGHQITDGDPEVRAALLAEYGDGFYRADGTLDRARVAARVFADRAARERLNQLVHPRIVTRIRDTIVGLIRAGWQGVVVVDAALMLDWHLERACDAVLAVVAPEAEQIARLRAARGWDKAEARARLAVQRTNEQFARAADATLENDGNEPALAAAARAALRGLIEARRSGARSAST